MIDTIKCFCAQVGLEKAYKINLEKLLMMSIYDVCEKQRIFTLYSSIFSSSDITSKLVSSILYRI